ncbi:AAA family ATPase [Corynebacterium kozikiae]|uniref:AAA family ATPase n=1 Tax=Corynebacterium kozikiae TaxID=2968469 RepID=UPI00211BFFA9|nr:AAA family ATPase [Corynebacterium sp. 76QC2CO]MCQ9344283.1 AAA family ATPase [Corynebacterium sp. 76QC2CO]
MQTAREEIKKNLNILREMQEKRIFKNMIGEIRFPKYKSLSSSFKIEFSFPITAILGPNGTNKTSILRAIQACPEGTSLSDYWFDTELDKVELDADSSASRQSNPSRYIYSYGLPSGAKAQVIKVRINNKKRGDDYWETSKPRITDGMERVPADEDVDPKDRPFKNKTRWLPLKKPVLYLDFRSQIPAYDIQMNFTWHPDFADMAAKKKRIRRYSKSLARALAGDNAVSSKYGKERVLNPVEEITGKSLEAISKILGRQYSSIKLVKHSFFGPIGWTAQLTADGKTYSEAFAGSGEFAVIMLVWHLSAAREETLVILDEPETSLHPGAQAELLSYIIQQTKEKKLQVVMATHSTTIAENLPPEARKLIDCIGDSGEVSVIAQAATLSEAFDRLGNLDPNYIYVEDRLAKEILMWAKRQNSNGAAPVDNIKVLPGGAETIKTTIIPSFIASGFDATVILDGDKRIKDRFESERDSRTGFLRSKPMAESLKSELEKLGFPDDNLIRNGNRKKSQNAESVAIREAQNEEVRSNAYDWIIKNVRFLPGMSPEALLYELLENGKFDDENTPNCESGNKKDYWIEATREDLGMSCEEKVTSDEIFNFQKSRLGKIRKSDGNSVADIVQDLLSLMR